MFPVRKENLVSPLDLEWIFSCEIGSWNPLSSVCFFCRLRELMTKNETITFHASTSFKKGKEVKIEWVKYQYKYTSEVRQFRRFFIVGSKWGHYSLVKSNTSLFLSLPLFLSRKVLFFSPAAKWFRRIAILSKHASLELHSTQFQSSIISPFLSSLPSLSSTLLYGSKHTQVKK